MLRVGLTGGLGSGKSTIAAMFERHGVHVLHADRIGQELMQPGQPVYRDILRQFSQLPDAPPLTLASGELDRAALARYAFSTGRIDDLNRIVHPPVIAEQERRIREIFRRDPHAIAMVESALIFEAERGGTGPNLRRRFDKVILVTAPENVRLARTVERMSNSRPLTPQEKSAVLQDARRRMAMQIPDAEKAALCDYIIDNSDSMEDVEARVEEVLFQLQKSSR